MKVADGWQRPFQLLGYRLLKWQASATALLVMVLLLLDSSMSFGDCTQTAQPADYYMNQSTRHGVGMRHRRSSSSSNNNASKLANRRSRQ